MAIGKLQQWIRKTPPVHHSRLVGYRMDFTATLETFGLSAHSVFRVRSNSARTLFVFCGDDAGSASGGTRAKCCGQSEGDPKLVQYSSSGWQYRSVLGGFPHS